MLKNSDWELIISNDPSDDSNLMAEIWRGNNEFADIRTKNRIKTFTFFKSNENIEIPFDWFIKVIQEAKERIE